MNKIFFSQVWDNSKNYGKYANEFMSLLPKDAYGCITDGDVMFLTNDYGKIIYDYVERYPNAVLTCKTNRIGCYYQKAAGISDNNHDIVYHKQIAQKHRKFLYNVTNISKETYPFSGMCMVIKKSIWEEVGKFKEDGLLGVDNDFFFALQKHNKEVYIMDGLYVYHAYRLDGSKTHLL